MSDSPIVIRTGLPGNGKTLNTIKEVDAYAKASGRVVYYHNIAGLNPDRLAASWFEFEDVLRWYELPRDSIIVVDEAQGSRDRPMFGTRDPRAAVPEHISRLETIRHGGYQLHLITQDPRFLDVHVRRLCNCHIHYWRIFGSNKVSRYEMPRVMAEVEKLSTFKDATRTIITLDKKFFGVYESAKGGHHFKFKPPKKLLAFGAVLLVTLYLFFQLYQRINQSTATDTSNDAAPSASSSVVSAVTGIVSDVLPGRGGSSKSLSLDRYLSDRVPRVDLVPSSAPIFDELTKPASYPRLICVTKKTRRDVSDSKSSALAALGAIDVVSCQCYTQQGTHYRTPREFCLEVAGKGVFDPGLAASSRADSENSPGAAAPGAAGSGSIVSVIADQEFTDRPWRK